MTNIALMTSVRHGTTTLFAALEVATGQATGLCKNRHRHQELLVFLEHVARAYPGRVLHQVMDNYATYKRPEINAWLAANPRIHVCFAPPPGHGSTWWRSGSASSNARPSGAAPSFPCVTSRPRSNSSSRAGMTANTRLFG